MAPRTDDTYRSEVYLRRPTKGRRSYALILRERAPDGKPGRAKTLKSTVINTINEQLRAGALKPDEAEEAARRELARMQEQYRIRDRRTSLLPANQRLLDRYWEAVYSHKGNKAVVSARARLRRAVAALGDVPLTASRDEIQEAVNRAADGDAGRQRRTVSALRQILKWMGRTDVVLSRMRKPVIQVRYVTLDEFGRLAACIPCEEHRILAWVAFATGCRLGEIFSLTERKFNRGSKTVYIDEQRLENWEPDDPKNGRARHAPVLREGLEWLRKWWAVPEERRREIRLDRYAAVIRAARDTLAADGGPRLDIERFHDLRHSYAIHLLNLGVSTSLVAQALGDSVQVVESHYLGFILTTPGIDSINRILDGGG